MLWHGPAFSLSGHRCNGDEPTQGFSDSVCVVPRAATDAAHTIAGAEAQALHILRPEQDAAAHAPPPADIAGDAWRCAVDIKHGFRFFGSGMCHQQFSGSSLSMLTLSHVSADASPMRAPVSMRNITRSMLDHVSRL